MRVPFNWLKEYIDTNLTPKDIAQKLTLVGHALDKPLYEQEGDTVMDLEDRGNRGDTTGIVGIARDLSAITGGKLRLPRGFNPEPVEGLNPITNNEKFLPKITVESSRVIRWRAVTFKGVLVGPSPEHIQKRLRAYGMEVINNVVDITNYIMIETGMPLHAFDLDKVKTIQLRTAKPGESLITFEGGKLLFNENDLLAADGEKPLTLTTAVGGKESGITDTTKNILIEAGLYDQPTARRSALRLNVRNETAGRLGKYLHPEYCEVAIARAIELMKEMLNVDPEPVSFDYYPNKYPEVTVSISRERLNLIAGEEIDLQEATKILESLEFEVLAPTITTSSLRHPELVSGSSSLSSRPESRDPRSWIPDQVRNDVEKNSITVKVPYYRTDVTMEDDVIEEILRIRGYNKIPAYLPNRPSPEKLEFPEMDLENLFRDASVKIGFNEVISQPIIDVKDSEKVGLANDNWKKKMVFLENSWNQELNLMRPEMISGQLKYLLSYQKQGVENIKIFEIGKTYTVDNESSKKGYEKYRETRKVVLTTNAGYISLKSQVETILKELGITDYEFNLIDFLFKKAHGSSITVNGKEIGKMGEVRNSVLAQFGINGIVSHAVFYTAKLLEHSKPCLSSAIKTHLPNFVSEDKTFKVGSDTEVGRLLEKLKRDLDPSTETTFLGVFENDELKKDNRKNVTFNFKFNPEKAQTESENLKGLTL